MFKSLAFAFLCSFAATTSYAQVTWEVINRFPLMGEAAFKRLVAELGVMEASTELPLEARLTQVDYRRKVRHLMETDGTDERPVWNERAQAHDAERLLSSTARIVGRSSLGSASCEWTLTRESDGAVVRHIESCDLSRPIAVELDQSYDLRATRIGDSSSASTPVLVRRHLVVAIGDSFTSGEGNPDYPAEFRIYAHQPPHDWAVSRKDVVPTGVVSARWLDNDCHRSLLSWPALYALRLALTRVDTVVQFASFACSGAEVIDGFLLPQQDPPGRTGVNVRGKRTTLRVSQQRALAELLCRGQAINEKAISLDADLHLYLRKYGNQSAQPAVASCEQPIRPHEVLVQFGGNDTAFGGVVKYVFQPPPLKYDRLGPFGLPVRGLVNQGLYKALAPVRPEDAAKLVKNLPKVYGHLNDGLAALNIHAPAVTVRLLMYPDPTITNFGAPEDRTELQACNGRTRDGNRPLQSLIANQLGFLKHDSAFAGVNVRRLLLVRETYVPDLRAAQRSAAVKHDWQAIDSQPAILGRGICSGGLECERLGEACPNADRVRWAFFPRSDKTNVMAPNSPPWVQMSDFKPYDLQRKRGMRYANDALLTSARIDRKNGGVRLDWVSSVAHPTAHVHAGIASLLSPPPTGRSR